MVNEYKGSQDDRQYHGQEAIITYNLKRCLHAEECVRGLAAVFDNQKRPWINTDGAPAAQIIQVIQRCPSGALHLIPEDENFQEPIPDKNIIYLEEDGYLRIVGNLKIIAAHVDIQHETRAALCRCGASSNKPFCDNTHLSIDFTAKAPTQQPQAQENPESEPGSLLTIIATSNGPYEINGSFEIRDSQGNLLARGTQESLCRCGHSANKPFCDSSHLKVGFKVP